MGSVDKACISGFLCRLCSEMHRVVIHVYGDHGLKLKLVDKINGYLPITISPNDHLPKTICETCLRRVEQHYDLLLRLQQYGKNRFKVNFKKMTTTPSRTSIGVNTDEFDPRPRLQSLLRRAISPTSASTVDSDYDDDEDDDDDEEEETESMDTTGNTIQNQERNNEETEVDEDDDSRSSSSSLSVILNSDPLFADDNTHAEEESDENINAVVHL